MPVLNISLTTVATAAGRVVRRNPVTLAMSHAQFDAVKITNANSANAGESTSNNISVIIDRRHAARTIPALQLPQALRISASEAALPPASLTPGRITLTPGNSLEFPVRTPPVPPVAANAAIQHVGFNVNTNPPREDSADHLDYHWDC